jgi:hypothetical protein
LFSAKEGADISTYFKKFGLSKPENGRTSIHWGGQLEKGQISHYKQKRNASHKDLLRCPDPVKSMQYLVLAQKTPGL